MVPTSARRRRSRDSGRSAKNASVIGTALARTNVGTLVAAVARRSVPNCSTAIVTITAQKPVAKPSHAQIA